MSYTKQEFKSGEKLYAAQLNAMDEQIAANAEETGRIFEEIAGITELRMSINLFNKETVDDSGLIYPMNNTYISGNYYTSDLIAVTEGNTYTWASPAGAYGEATGKRLAVFDKDKNYIGYLDGTYTGVTLAGSNTSICTVVIDSAYQKVTGTIAYIRFGMQSKEVDVVMFINGDSYPSVYIPYGAITELNENVHLQSVHVDRLNPLYGKKLACNGDSICAGAGASGGYAAIIGEMYNMTVQNIGVNGGTITAEVYRDDGVTARHWISRTIENMDADADYIIVEGGVNDSSLSVPLGSITSDYDDTLNDATFYGAFESMLKQLLIRYPGKKIGYIAVHQMSANFRVNNEKETSYYWAAKLCCEKWGIPFLDLNATVPPFGPIRNTTAQAELYAATRALYTYNEDGWHPNEEGYKRYYVPKIISWMEAL